MKKLAAILLIVGLCMILPYSSLAQSLYEVPIEEKIQKSPLIIEGKVTAQKSFWNPSHTMIYTANTVEVYKTFKGAYPSSTIEIVTTGGTVEGLYIEASELLSLTIGDVGMFFCAPSGIGLRSPETGNLLWKVYSSSQGFFQYSLPSQTASGPFVRYNDIATELYTELQTKTGRSFQNKNPSFDVKEFRQDPGGVNAPAITGFSPTVVNAGATLDPTMNEITITGTGFTTPVAPAAVFFDDANDGSGGSFFGVSATSNLIISWTDTEIRMRVPTRAGTGSIIVRDNLNALSPASAVLTVNYSIITGTFTSGSTVTKEGNLMDMNGSGGYDIFYSTSTAGSGIDLSTAPQLATFQRALTTWRQMAGTNITEAGNTVTQAVANDGENVIMFDNANTLQDTLDAGVLGVCYFYLSMCTPVTTNQAQNIGFDIIIRNPGYSLGSTSFSTGPCPPMASNFNEIDLETVLLHELGHAIGLAHINDTYQGINAGQLNPGKLMNYAIVISVKRSSLDWSAYTGGLYLTNMQGNTYGVCGLGAGEMSRLALFSEARDECQEPFPIVSTPPGTVVNFNLVHATSNKNVDPQFGRINTDPTRDSVSVTNTAFQAIRTNTSGGTLSLSVSGYATTPASQAACTPAYVGYPVTGVELALYQVSACPAGQAFPVPVAYRQFAGNGAITNITGLAANTNYLIFVDGIENTKATFSLTLTGSALPISFSEFTGEVKKSYNLLRWAIDLAYDVKSISIEKSADGVNFEPIGEVTGSIYSKKGDFMDVRPFVGNNYYRLATVNLDGSKEYSKIVLLKRNDAFLVTVYPNPADDYIYLDISAQKAGKYNLVIYNSIGQAVIRRTLQVNAGQFRTQINIGHLPGGIYQFNLHNDKNEVVENTRINIR